MPGAWQREMLGGRKLAAPDVAVRGMCSGYPRILVGH
jgi:hypothetical protein